MTQLQNLIKQASEQLWLVIILLVILPPLGIYLLWKGEYFDIKKRKIISTISALWFVLYLIDAEMKASNQGGYDSYQSCSATFYQNGCTYYRDDNCNVVAKSCD